MLTSNEIRSMNDAIAAATKEVERLEREAGGHSLIFLSDAERVADAARATLNAIINVRNAAIEDGNHESALQVVENARKLSGKTIGTAIEREVPLIPDLGDLTFWIKAGLVVAGLIAISYLISQGKGLAKMAKGFA